MLETYWYNISMGLWIKKNPSTWVEAKEVWVKKDPSTWVKAKQIWVKKTANLWTMFWPQAGPYPEEDIYVFTSLDVFPSLGNVLPELTAYVYHFTFDGTLTLKYRWEYSNSETGPFDPVDGFSTYQTYQPGNPSSGSFNTLSFTPQLSDYVYGRTYFRFIMQATDSSATSTYETFSVPIFMGGPYWYQTPSFSGIPSPNQTLTWNTGQGRIQGTSDNVGYMTTIYRTNDNGATKEYLYGTATEPDYSFSDNYLYEFDLTSSDIGYTYHASTYSIYGEAFAPFEYAEKSLTISDSKKVVGPPGPFSITSFIKGKKTGNLSNASRTLTLNYSVSADADYYQFKIEKSIDGVTWYSFADYFSLIPATDPTTSITLTDSNTQNYVYYRANMRALNASQINTQSTNINVDATGQPPGAPTITSASVSFGTVQLFYTETTDFGSGTGIYAHDFAYKLSTDTSFSSWIYTTSYGGQLDISGLTEGLTYSFKIRSYNDDNVVGPESNTVTVTIPAQPGALSSIDAKTWSSGSLTVGFTTGNNTTGVYYFATNGPYVGSGQFVRQISGLFSNLSSNTSYVRDVIDFPTTDDQYDVIFYAQNATVFGDNVGTESQVATAIYPDGSDKPLASVPTFSNITASSFTANYALFNTTSAIIDIRSGGSSIPGYPQTLSQSSGKSGASFTHTPSITLSNSTTYTFFVTPYYQSTIAPLMLEFGVQKNASVSTNYQFSFGKTLYVSSNGHIGLESGSSSFTDMSSGKNIAILVKDLQQWYLAEYSDTNFYHLYFRSYLFGETNSAANAVDYQIKFYNDPSIPYCDVYMVRVGANVTLPSIQRGYYGSGNTQYAGTDGASFFIGTGSTFRVYFNGTPMKTTGVSWTTINDNIWDVIQTWPYPNTLDDGFTSVVTAPNQQAAILTPPTISSINVSNTGGPVSVNFTGGSGPFYQAYWYTSPSAPTGQVTPDASGSSSPLTDSTGPTSTATQYMYVRSVQTVGELSLGPSSLASSWSAGVAFNMTTPVPSGGIASITTNTGNYNVGSIITYSTSGWTNSPTSYNLRLYNGTNPVLTSDPLRASTTSASGTYTITSSDVDKFFKVFAIANNSGGSSTEVSSTQVGPATVVAVIPTISMSANSGISQTAGTINWTSTNQASFSSTGTFSATGTTGTSISKTGLTAGTTYTGTVTVTSSSGHTASANYSLTTSAATAPPTGGSVSVSPSSGTAGTTQFTATPSGWSGTPSSFTYTYSWQYMNSSFSWVQAGTGSTFTPSVISPTPLAWRVVLTVSNGVSPNGTATASFTVNNPVTPTPNITQIQGIGLGNTTAPYINFTFTSTDAASLSIMLYRSDTSSTGPWTALSARVIRNTTGSFSIDFSSRTGTVANWYYVDVIPYSGSNATGVAGTLRTSRVRRSTQTTSATLYP